MFPDPCGARLAEAVKNGADPRAVIPDDYLVVRGGTAPMEPPGVLFSGATGPTLEAAAAAVPHGQVRAASVGAIRANGGTVEWAPEMSRGRTLNNQHVNITEAVSSVFSGLQPNPVPRTHRVK